MNKQTLDKVPIGIIAGLLGAILGFVLFGLLFCAYEDVTFADYIHKAFLGISDLQSRIVSLSILLNVVLFFFLIKKEWYNMAKGLMVVMVVCVPVVVWLY
ncbi:MAG: hypothetical protein ACKVOR_01820 [Flavobacteriales bacterium]